MKTSIETWLKNQMGDDSALINEIYEEYRTTTARLVGELKAALAAHAEFAVTDRIAHTLKGNALMVGDQELFEVVQGMRAQMKDGDFVRASETMPQVEALQKAL